MAEKDANASAHLFEVSTAPLRIRAVQAHYIKTISKLTGRPESELHAEIEAIFQQLLLELQRETQANRPA